MTYVIKLINGDKIEVSEEAYKLILARLQQDAKGLIVLGNGEAINPSSISNIVPASKALASVDRTKQLEGVTPQGEVVIKRFGRWYYRDVNEYQVDEAGQSILEYHGEQLLPTPQEFEAEFKHLAPEAWTSKLIGRSSEVDPRLLLDRSNRTTQGGFQPIFHNHLPGGQP